MSLNNSPDSSQMDLYDQDHYSIPDDELRSVNSSVHSTDSEDGDHSMSVDDNHRNMSNASKTSTNAPPRSAGTAQSETPEWKTIKPRKHQVAKKYKTVELPLHFNPRESDRDLPHIGGRPMEEVKEALGQVATDDRSDGTSSSYRRRVPLTTLATNDDFMVSHSTVTTADDVSITDSILKKPPFKTPTTSTGEDLEASGSLPPNTIQKRVPSDKYNASGITRSPLSTAGTNSIPRSPANTISSSRVLTTELKAPGATTTTNKPTKPTFSNMLLNEDIDPSSKPTTFFTYRAQLTFGLSPSSDGINVAKYFRRWVFSSSESIDHFSLIPYEDEKGQQVSSLDQVPEDNALFYAMYYHNHRVLAHGNLTGMVAFQSSIPWSKLKSPTHPFFNWLRLNKVFLNQVKFKASSLVPCGFLLGAHPGHLRRDEAEEELSFSLGFSNGEELPFQLSSRSVSVPVKDGSPDRYSFQAVVAETSTQQAANLKEKFFSLGNPLEAVKDFPYTGKYMFVPFLKTKEWTVAKILSLAKLHVKIVQDLKPIFIANLKSIHNSIGPGGETLMQGFYGMQYKYPAIDGQEPVLEPLLHSIHNTAKPTTKVALVPTNHYDAAITQLSAIHSILSSNIPQEYHDRVFVASLKAGITGQQIDTISSCNSAAYATELLNRFNPQDGDEDEDLVPVKRFRSVPLSYAAVTNINSNTNTDISKETVSSVTSADLDQLFEKMKQHVAGDIKATGINIDDLEAKMSQSTKEVQAVRDQLSQSVASISNRVDTLAAEVQCHNTKISDEIQRQNVIILGMQQQFQDTMADFSQKLQAIYSTSSHNATFISPPSSTSKPKQWGDKAK
jgi:hypothetical protein